MILPTSRNNSTCVSIDKIHRYEVLQSIEKEIRSHPILKHQFLEKLSNGEFSRDQIAVWISQQFYFSNQFPRCLAALYARVEDFEASKPLMEFLAVEHWGSEEKSAHWKQFTKTLQYFGYDIHDLKGKKPFDETKEYLDYRLNICLRNSVYEGLGAIGFGHEFVNVMIFDSYFRGIDKIPNIPEQAVKYFKVHKEDEPHDYQIFKKIILESCLTIESLELVKKGAEDVLAARQVFFSKIHERISIES